MSRRGRAGTDPRTLASIALGRVVRRQGAVGEILLYACGCDEQPGRDYIWLCPYHEGFEDALDVAGNPDERAGHGEATVR